MTATFWVGNIWEPEDVITDPRTKAKVDPTAVTYTVTNPKLETTVAAAATKLGVGEYTARIELTEPGQWKVVFYSTGTYKGDRPESITVYPV